MYRQGIETRLLLFMKEKLTKKELVCIASMLFGLFFGAGNLIFPIYMGQLAGANMWKAVPVFMKL